MIAAGLALAPAVAASPTVDGGTPGTVTAGPTVEGGTPGTVTASFSPSTVCYTSAAQSFALTVDVSKLAAKGALRTLFVTVPSGYTVSGSVTASAGTPSVLTVSSTNYIRVGGLKLVVGSSVTVTFSATESSAGGTASWKLEGETGNDSKPDNDTPGGDDYYAPTLPTTTVALGCALTFIPGPADAGKTLNITSVALTPSGAPVAVDVTDTNSVVLTPVITLSLNKVSLDPGSTTSPMLNGGAAVTATATSTIPGVATFVTLNVNDPGSYTLTATASMAGISSITSGSFRIWGAAAACTSGCATPPLTGSGGETVNVASNSDSGGIGASLDILSIDCSATEFGGVAGLPGTDTVTWTSNGLSAGKILQLSIPNSLLNPATNGSFNPLLAAHYMVCVSAPYAFSVAWTPAAFVTSTPPTYYPTANPDPQVSGVMGVPYYRGLLPDCQDVGVSQLSQVQQYKPCVASRVYGAAGLTVTVWAAGGDPFGR